MDRPRSGHRSPRRPTLPIVIRYILLQLPGVAGFILLLTLLRWWLKVPDCMLWVLLALWLGKDIVLFPFLWRYYDPRPFDRYAMIGRKGVALTRLDPRGHGYVGINGERWRAEIAADAAVIKEGTAICVDSADGLKLTVSACPDG